MELAELPAVHFADPEGFTFMPLLLDVSGVDQRQLVLPVATTIFAGHMW
jgi:hypothetical protein